MLEIQEIVDYIFQIAPNPPWATENIYEIGHGDRTVTGVGIAWWITGDILRQMIADGINFGLSHERVIYDLPEWYPWGPMIPTDQLPANWRFRELCEQNGTVIHRFHSNLDLADFGMPHALVDELGWSSFSTDWTRGVPVVSLPPTRLGDLLCQIKTRLNLPFVRYDGDPERVISRVALAWGGLGQNWFAAACASPIGFDVLISGDVIDGVVRLAREQDWAVIDAMHHATEMPAMRKINELLLDKFPSIKVKLFENSNPWKISLE